MKVLGRRFEQKPPDAGKDRIADVAILPGHGVRRNSTEKAIAHYEVGARAQAVEERTELAEIIAVVQVAHDAIFAARNGYGAA